MNEALNSNLKEIEKHQPHLFRVLIETLNQGVSGFELKEESGFLELFEGSSKIDSTSNEFWKDVQISPASHLMIEGFGLGLGLQKALSLNPKSILVLEPSAKRFIYSLSLTHFGDIWKNPKVFWFVGMHPENAFVFYQSIYQKPPRSLSMDHWSLIEHPVLSKMYSGFFDQIKDEFQAARNQIRLSYGSLSDSLWGFRNVIENIDFIENTSGITEIRDEYVGDPAIIVSAGPSLKKSLPKIKELKDKALIIATDATASILLKAEIRPDFVCTLERGMGSKKYFEAITENLKAPLVAYPHVPKEVLDAYPGPKRCIYRDYSYYLYMESKISRGIMPSSSSVAHMCLRLADYLGCSEVVLVGQDLSFDPESFQSHVDGIAYSEWQEKQTQVELEKKLAAQNQSLFWIPGNLIEKVPTNSTYFSFLKEFGFEKTRTRAQIWNATEGGAQIPTIAWRSLEDISKDWAVIAKRDLSDEADSFDEKSNLDFTEIIEILKSFSTRLENLLNQSKGSQNEIKDDQLLRQVLELIHSAKKEIEKNPVFSAFVLEMNARSYLDIENEMMQSKMKSARDQLQVQMKWFREMKDALHQVLDTLPHSK